MDSIGIVNKSLSAWLESSEAKKYFLALLALQLIVLGIYLTAYYAAAGEDFFSRAYLPEAQAQEVDAQVMPKIIGTEIALLPLSVFYGLLAAYIYFLLIMAALKQLSFKTERLKLKKFVMAYVLIVASFLAALFSWFEKKFLTIPAAAILLIVFSGAAGTPEEALPSFLALLALVLVIVYVFVALRNGLRLLLALPVFLSENKGIAEALSESWRITEGKALKIFFPFAALLAITVIAGWTFGYVFSEIGKFLGIATGFIALAVLLQSAAGVFISSLYAVWSNYFSVLLLREFE
ncbi:MAG TPA: hypothetical protein VFF09_02640 [archaeon]|nr:hypothetical protein [archaeon]